MRIRTHHHAVLVTGIHRMAIDGEFVLRLDAEVARTIGEHGNALWHIVAFAVAVQLPLRYARRVEVQQRGGPALVRPLSVTTPLPQSMIPPTVPRTYTAIITVHPDGLPMADLELAGERCAERRLEALVEIAACCPRG